MDTWLLAEARRQQGLERHLHVALSVGTLSSGSRPCRPASKAALCTVSLGRLQVHFPLQEAVGGLAVMGGGKGPGILAVAFPLLEAWLPPQPGGVKSELCGGPVVAVVGAWGAGPARTGWGALGTDPRGCCACQPGSGSPERAGRWCLGTLARGQVAVYWS